MAPQHEGHFLQRLQLRTHDPLLDSYPIPEHSPDQWAAIEASILAQEIDAMYLHWGLLSIEGLTIDGEPATAVGLLEKGPEELSREVVSAIKEQCGLSEPERKN